MSNRKNGGASAVIEDKIEVRQQDETVWLTQKLMADLFQTTPQNITTHLRNIFNESELNEGATCKDFLQVQLEENRQVERKQRFYKNIFLGTVSLNAAKLGGLAA